MKKYLNLFLNETHAITGLFFLALGIFAPSYKLFIIYLVGFCCYILIKNQKQLLPQTEKHIVSVQEKPKIFPTYLDFKYRRPKN